MAVRIVRGNLPTFSTHVLAETSGGGILQIVGASGTNSFSATVAVDRAQVESRWAELWQRPVPYTINVEQDVKPAMEQRGPWPTKPIKLAFLIHSLGMNSQDPNTWSYELRKGNYTGSVVIGIKQDETTGDMDYGQWVRFQMLWCPVFFTFVGLGWTFDKAFRYTNWMFKDLSKFTVFAGDINMSKADLTTQ